MDTKTKIAQASLSLFSKNGYQAVSVRDISGTVGIKESTIYYHYKNKEDILIHLQNEFRQITKQMTDVFSNNAIVNVTKKSYLHICNAFIDRYLLNAFVIRFIKLLSIEQAHNSSLARLYEDAFFDTPIAFQTAIFKALIADGLLISTDPSAIAAHYYSYVFFLYQKHIVLKEPTQADIAAFKDQAGAFFINHFAQYERTKYA